MFPEKEYLSAEIPFANLSGSNSVFDDENYDDDEEPEKEEEMVDKSLESQSVLPGLISIISFDFTFS